MSAGNRRPHPHYALLTPLPLCARAQAATPARSWTWTPSTRCPPTMCVGRGLCNHVLRHVPHLNRACLWCVSWLTLALLDATPACPSRQHQRERRQREHPTVSLHQRLGVSHQCGCRAGCRRWKVRVARHDRPRVPRVLTIQPECLPWLPHAGLKAACCCSTTQATTCTSGTTTWYL